jgi:hypothetical protein
MQNELTEQSDVIAATRRLETEILADLLDAKAKLEALIRRREAVGLNTGDQTEGLRSIRASIHWVS